MFDGGKKPAKRVLMFNPRKNLIALFHSAIVAAKAMNSSTQAIHCACTGKTICSGRMYYRYVPEDIEITIEDMGTLTVEEFDSLCGVTRKVYGNTHMSRKGMKYNMIKKANGHESTNYQ